MYFNSEKAFGFLKTTGHVYTLRPVGKRSPAEEIVVDIRHKSRKTQFRAMRVFLRQINLSGPYNEILKTYVPETGFSSLEEWTQEALTLSGPQNWWNLFEVTKL